FELYASQLKGIWYEAGRVPKTNALQCLNVTVPDNADSGDLELDLEYIATYDGSGRAVRETVKFPWDTYTSNSIFNLYYGSDYPTVTYKVIYTDPGLLTLICGYMAISPMPLVKILTRERELDEGMKGLLDQQMLRLGITDYFMWSEQDPDKCNAADRPAICVIAIIGIAFLQSLTASWIR
ncbi:hypothetical protein KR044_004533, partial [Drosophila immigrans]